MSWRVHEVVVELSINPCREHDGISTLDSNSLCYGTQESVEGRRASQTIGEQTVFWIRKIYPILFQTLSIAAFWPVLAFAASDIHPEDRVFEPHHVRGITVRAIEAAMTRAFQAQFHIHELSQSAEYYNSSEWMTEPLGLSHQEMRTFAVTMRTPSGTDELWCNMIYHPNQRRLEIFDCESERTQLKSLLISSMGLHELEFACLHPSEDVFKLCANKTDSAPALFPYSGPNF